MIYKNSNKKWAGKWQFSYSLFNLLSLPLNCEHGLVQGDDHGIVTCNFFHSDLLVANTRACFDLLIVFLVLTALFSTILNQNAIGLTKVLFYFLPLFLLTCSGVVVNSPCLSVALT